MPRGTLLGPMEDPRASGCQPPGWVESLPKDTWVLGQRGVYLVDRSHHHRSHLKQLTDARGTCSSAALATAHNFAEPKVIPPQNGPWPLLAESPPRSQDA